MDNAGVRSALTGFADWVAQHIRGDEKGEAQVFLDRYFAAFGHSGAIEAGAVYEDRLRSADRAGVRFADLMWKPRVLIEMKKRGTDLSRHYRQAFDYWAASVPDRPRYVVLCNFDEFWIYDFNSQMDAPVDRVRVEDLAARHEALAFMLPVQATPIFGNDLVKVTRGAAVQVSGVFRSMVDRGVERHQAQHFVLQCVATMFSEDIGLLPEKFFTRTLVEASSAEQAYDMLNALFREMNTPGTTSGGTFKGTPYFNGGIFAVIHPVELEPRELDDLRKACETDWSDVRPEVFGTLFESSMNKDERHAYGAHFTSAADIMSVIGPSIVAPWMTRIEAARTIGDLEQLLLAMSSFKVLDPACGSGNFLYVAYRELRRLEAEIRHRIDERRKSPGLAAQTSLSYVNTDNFLGLDINEFAVEVAKLTLMMAKKLASDELDGGQANVLPLDNLDENIRHADALFTTWPTADVIIGNPPYLGRRKMAEELGLDYVQALDARYPNPGVSDFVTYWFPLAHEHLPEGGHAGLVATQAVRDNDSRERSLDYIVDNDGVITDAVSTQPWSGDAVVHVAIVNWVKGSKHAPDAKVLWLDQGRLRLVVDHIPPTLRPAVDVSRAQPLSGNKKPKRCFQGQTAGFVAGFRLSADEARHLVATEPAAIEVVHPLLSGDPLLHSTAVSDFIIDIGERDLLRARTRYPEVMKLLTAKVLPDRVAAAQREAKANEKLLAKNPGGTPVTVRADFLERSWWLHWRRRGEMLEAFAQLDRYIALTRVAAEGRKSVYQFVDPTVRPDDSLQTFAFDDDYSFGVLSSGIHRAWFDERCSRLKVDPRYTSTTVWDSFPWPASPTEAQVSAIARVSAEILRLRESYIRNATTLAEMYDSLRTPGASELRQLHDTLDKAVFSAYEFSETDDVLAQLLALNVAYASDPAAARRPGGHSFGTAAYASRYRLRGPATRESLSSQSRHGLALNVLQGFEPPQAFVDVLAELDAGLIDEDTALVISLEQARRE